ncbi:hypothetical protein OX459_00115 [Janthinobacterium sp. SUN026]|uniref:hypothetical protein n=1 Tax=Janthinobacterium sp. SUN026 TaxID=3002438 RepID=UPI0025B1C78D|nr:hypothetical protein [Janthinobacterium sp. SUN026]MDN2669789.1 hypothetical protein [Janthinobacterium sp. SUN026]
MTSIIESESTMFFSSATRGFYPEQMRADYDAAGTWPDDAVEVSPEDETRLRDAIAASASIRMTAGGKWKITAPPPPPFSMLAAPYLASVRQTRDAILNRLAGIGFAAVADGDADTVQAIAAARAWLLDITICPTVAAAQDIETLQAAVSAEYARIAATLSDEARRAFADAGITLASPVTP